jgi:hypothetical protein
MARQPIFDRSVSVYGYELLYRSAATGGYDGTDGAVASMQALSSSLFGFGLDRLLKGKPGFVNFPRDLLVMDFSSPGGIDCHRGAGNRGAGRNGDRQLPEAAECGLPAGP